MMSVAKTQLGQIQLFIRGDRVPETLFQKRGQGIIIIALPPGAIDACNANRRIADTLDAKRNALPDIDYAFFDIGTFKKRYLRILACHLITPYCLSSKPQGALKVSLLFEFNRRCGKDYTRHYTHDMLHYENSLRQP
jgi:hypothetical protein